MNGPMIPEITPNTGAWLQCVACPGGIGGFAPLALRRILMGLHTAQRHPELYADVTGVADPEVAARGLELTVTAWRMRCRWN